MLLPALLLAAGCGLQVNYDYGKEPDPRRSEYVIGVADHLTVHVWRNPELSGSLIVRPDGTITMPLIGDLRAEGQTPTQLRDDIAKRLSRYVRDEGAVVTVAVAAVNSYSFTVSGNVEHAGVFTSQKYVTVLEAIQLAGGPNRFATPRKLLLLRKESGKDGNGKVRGIPIDYPSVLEGKQSQGNLVLLPGDQLHMP